MARSMAAAVFAVVVVALIVALVSQCGGIDRGRCLVGHDVAYHRDAEFQCLPALGFDGQIALSCHDEPARDWTERVCDEWEFPHGRAERSE